MSSVSRQSLRFTHVRLENWRNFKAVDVDLAQRVFLVGPNASGKSNFLDAFRFLRDLAAVGGGLQSAVGRRGGVSRIRSLAARRQPDVSIAVGVGADDDPGRWTYELSFTQDAKRRALLKRERVTREGREIHARPRDEDESDPERRTQTSLEQVNVNREFRELADFFASVRYLHIVPQLIREPDRSVGRAKDPFGGDFLEQVATTPKKKRDSYFRQVLRVAKVAVPQLQELRLEADERGAWHLKGRYQHWRPQGAWQTEQDLSDGTLRLFGLLWAVLEEGGAAPARGAGAVAASGGGAPDPGDALPPATPVRAPDPDLHPLARAARRRGDRPRRDAASDHRGRGHERQACRRLRGDPSSARRGADASRGRDSQDEPTRPRAARALSWLDR